MLTLSGALAGTVGFGPAASAAPGDINTIAGSVGQGPATSVAQIPLALASQGARLYTADYYAVRVLDTDTGIETVFAGTGMQGFSGDGGPATKARLDGIRALAADETGNVYIATSHRIRRVDVSGTITTVAGNDFGGPLVDGVPATTSPLLSVNGLGLDGAGNLYISDCFAETIRRVDTAGIITTVAGDPQTSAYTGDGGPATAASLSCPMGIAVDAPGNIVIADSDNHAIRKVSAADGKINTVAAGFPDVPEGVAVDSASGNTYVGSQRWSEVRRIDADGNVTTAAGTPTAGFGGDGGPATAAELTGPYSLAVDQSGNLFAGDLYNHRVREVDGSGIIKTVAGNGSLSFSGDGGPAVAAQLGGDGDYAAYDGFGRLARDGAGNLFIADTQSGRVRRLDSSGTITTIAGDGSTTLSGDGGPATAAGLALSDHYSGLAVDASGDLYISAANRVRKVDSAGIISTLLTGLNHPDGLRTDSDGNLYIADADNSRVLKLHPSGALETVAGNGTAGFAGDGGPATAARLSQPRDIALDPSGNLYIAEGSRVRKVTPDGIITTFAGNGSWSFSGDGGPAAAAGLRSAISLAADPAGNLLIADGARVRQVTDGIISTVAGGGSVPAETDQGSARTATVPTVRGLVVDGSGNIFLSGGESTTFIWKVAAPVPVPPGRFVAADFDGDFRADVSVFRPSTSTWYVRPSGGGETSSAFGLAGDIAVPADYNGDHRTDVAVFRPATGGWYVQDGSIPTTYLGLPGDVPVPADYNGDGTADVAVFRPSTGAWYVNGVADPTYFGLPGDIPVPADYNGDGKAERAVFRPSVGAWYVEGQPVAYFGLNGDVPVAADYNGDGKAEIAVFRPSVGGWYVQGQDPTFYGLAGDVPVSGDYDGNGTADVAVFRPSVGAWYVGGASTATFFGLTGDAPLPLAAGVRQSLSP